MIIVVVKKRLIIFKFQTAHIKKQKSKSPGKNKFLVVSPYYSIIKSTITTAGQLFFPPDFLLRGFYMEGAYPVFAGLLVFKCVSNGA